LGSNKPFLAITLGDPAGIGPWVGAAAALDPGLRRRCRPVLVGDTEVLRRFWRGTADLFPLADLKGHRDRPVTLNILHVSHPGISSLQIGRPSRLSGEAAVLALREAVRLAGSGQVAAIVTGPVSKESFKAARVPYPGHTELLQAMTGARRAEMLMTAGPLRALLITRHLPLMNVSSHLSVRGIVESVRLCDAAVARLAGRKPRWIMAGLNPHAGDNGLLGGEEKRVVSPAVRALRAAGVRVEGPLPADVAWARHAEGLADAVACLYHDQGMIPLKTMHPHRVVNVTVGLPLVRTSPGHGTAFDLAHPGGGKKPFAGADPGPTLEAAHRALDLATGRRSPHT
jgi:4-phospho-D-threonate 3-dehydrogenase / 4-phospho-D-erythronate 3-dehydrogenase